MMACRRSKPCGARPFLNAIGANWANIAKYLIISWRSPIRGIRVQNRHLLCDYYPNNIIEKQKQSSDKDELEGNNQPKCDWLRFAENAQRRTLFARGYGGLASPDLIDDYDIQNATNN